MDLSYKKKSCMTFGFVALLLFAAAVVVTGSRKHVFQGHQYLSTRQFESFSKEDTTNRRLLVSRPADYDDYDGDYGNGGDDGSGTMDRIISSECSKEKIYISQGQTSPLPNGIPTYTVLIQNICMSDSISGIHLTCGWFSSARLINPNVFKRISYNDCLVNNGNPINPGQTISFQYANTYPYPLSVSYVQC